MSGNTVSLCVECCAYWRKIGRDEPDLAPSAIRLIVPGNCTRSVTSAVDGTVDGARSMVTDRHHGRR